MTDALKTSALEPGFTPCAGGAMKANARMSDSRRRNALTRHPRSDRMLIFARSIGGTYTTMMAAERPA